MKDFLLQGSYSQQEINYKINLQHKKPFSTSLAYKSRILPIFYFLSIFYFSFFSPASMRVISYMLIQSFLLIPFAIAAIYLSLMLLACERGTRTSDDV